MTFPVVQSVTQTSFSSASTSHNVAMPATANTGDLLLIIIAFGSGLTGDPAAPSGWTEVVQSGYAAEAGSGVFARRSNGTEGGTTVDCTTSGSVKAAAQVYRITGWRDSGTLTNDIEAGTVGFGQNVSQFGFYACNPTNWDVEDTLWLACVPHNGTASVTTWPTNYTNGWETFSGGTGSAGSKAVAVTSRRENAVASEQPSDFYCNASVYGYVWCMAIRPAAGGDVSVGVTTVLGTGAVGSVGITKSGEVALTGTNVLGIGAVGTVTASQAKEVAISTVLGTGAVQAMGVTKSGSVAITTVAGLGAVGTMTQTHGGTVALTTVAGVGAVGDVGVSGDQTRAITTVLATTAVGSFGFTESGSAAISTVAGTGAVGSVGITTTYGRLLSGVSGTGNVGTLGASVAGTPTQRLGRIEVHDPSTHALIDVLENVYDVAYELAANQSSVASFKMPRDDAKWSSVVPFREVYLYDDLGTLIDVFRIMPTKELHNERALEATVELEGYATVLQDDIVPAEYIWTNQTVTQIVTDILGYQSTARITLGTIDAALDITLSYRVSYDNLMKALWELRNVVGGYISVDADPATPSTRELNLRENPGQTIGQRIWRGWNLRELGIASDPTEAVTKVYPLGRGEGPSQMRPSTDFISLPVVLTNEGVVGEYARIDLGPDNPYLRYKGWTAEGAALPNGSTALDTRTRPMQVNCWHLGVATNDASHWVQGPDEREIRSTTTNYTLPSHDGGLTLQFVAADYLIADDTVGTYGIIVRPYTDKRPEGSLELIFEAMRALDVVKQPRVTYTVKVADIVRMLATADPAITYEAFHLYDTVLVWDDDLDMAQTFRVVSMRYRDLDNPETFEIVLGTLTSQAPEARLQDRQRKYENMPDGASNIWVDSFEDNVDATHPYERNVYIPEDAVTVMKVSLNMKARQYRKYESAAAGSATSDATGGGQYVLSNNDNSGGQGSTTDAQGTHNHAVTTAPGTTSDDGSHSHNVAAHSHTIGHGHSLPNHSHNHSHDISVTLTAGIYEGGTHTTMTMLVDNANTVPGTAINVTDLDLTPYLSRSNDGRINRGWHTIKFTPNGVGRVQCSIVAVVYLQSRGVVAG